GLFTRRKQNSHRCYCECAFCDEFHFAAFRDADDLAAFIMIWVGMGRSEAKPGGKGEQGKRGTGALGTLKPLRHKFQPAGHKTRLSSFRVVNVPGAFVV